MKKGRDTRISERGLAPNGSQRRHALKLPDTAQPKRKESGLARRNPESALLLSFHSLDRSKNAEGLCIRPPSGDMRGAVKAYRASGSPDDTARSSRRCRPAGTPRAPTRSTIRRRSE